eukprot:7328617-Heterocapsa_arctica.AAC.1
MITKLRSNGISYSTERPLLHAFAIEKLAELLAPTIPPRDVEEDLSKSLRGKRGSTSRKADV